MDRSISACVDAVEARPTAASGGAPELKLWATTWYVKADSLRLATNAGSRLRIVPAAALRGLAKSGSPACSRSRLVRSNEARGR
jgi:hypothetical protein